MKVLFILFLFVRLQWFIYLICMICRFVSASFSEVTKVLRNYSFLCFKCIVNDFFQYSHIQYVNDRRTCQLHVFLRWRLLVQQQRLANVPSWTALQMSRRNGRQQSRIRERISMTVIPCWTKYILTIVFFILLSISCFVGFVFFVAVGLFFCCCCCSFAFNNFFLKRIGTW